VFLCLGAPFRTGWRRREKKAEDNATSGYVEEALEDFSGYIAADELYDGPFCVLFIVDNRNFKRLVYDVLDHTPNHGDMVRFFRRFSEALAARGLVLKGITTDGSPLYPVPIKEVFGTIPHQVCEFHVIAELTKAVLKAVAKIRRELKSAMPILSRGRPASEKAKRAARRKKRLEKKVSELFEYRYLMVQHHLSARDKKTLTWITRGQPHLRTLRSIMDEVYRLFDRRCRTDTALEKLAKLRNRVRRFKKIGKTLQKLFSPNLDKAITFLDDRLLPSTSNAVERGNRRYRKTQKTIYRVRTKEHVSQRIALDMRRDAQAPKRRETTLSLHKSRIGQIEAR